MSTSYGSIKFRDGSTLEVEAFGSSGAVKLIRTNVDILGFEQVPSINDPTQIDKLISLLEIARDHVWKSDG